VRVWVLATGEMELIGLPVALKARFPAHEFEAQRAPNGGPFDGFTSCRLPLPSRKIPSNLTKLVQETVRLIEQYEDGLVLIIDDVELCNMDQLKFVGDEVRAAFEGHLQARFAPVPDETSRRRRGRQEDEARLREQLRQRVSFHLARPMIESWVFADPYTHGAQDPEEFSFAEPRYLLDDGAACERWRGLRSSKQAEHKPLWLKLTSPALRAQHPKAALAWLHQEPTEMSCSAYRETHEGAEALKVLDWSAVLNHSRHMAALRSLHNDLASDLDPARVSEGDVLEETRLLTAKDARLLRNLRA
jgi:hypothetical protein